VDAFEVEAEELDGADVPLALGEVLLKRDEHDALVKMETSGGVAAEAHRHPQSCGPVPQLGQHHVDVRGCGVRNR
jgi:hypothetical protein